MIEKPLQPGSLKVYIKVTAEFDENGSLVPVAFVWEDGRKYAIDRVLDVRRASSLKAGGVGIRYTCSVHGKEIFLYLEENRWFMERKGE